MRPILYSKNETRFDTYGLGEIDALKGNATRERNGNYSAYLEYPASGPLASVFEKEMKFKADAGTRTKNQTFEIVRVVKDSSSTIKIYAQHISHKLEYMSIRHGIKVSGTADLALKTWAKNLIGDYHFDTWSDIDTVLPITFLVDKMENARLALGGVEGSILDTWGGEYEFDNQTVRLHKRLGRRAPTVLEYGRNILSAESDESIESAYTSVVPFATYTPESQEGDSRQQDPILVTIPEGYVDSKYVSMYANRRIKVVDFSSEFKDEGTGESKKKDIPTPEKLKALAIKYMENNRIGAPKINTKIEYVDLAQTLDYAERGWIEELELCDIVPVYYPEIGITEDDAKVTRVVYDFLNDRNESVEFGLVGESIRSAMTGGLAGRLDDLEKSQQSLENRQSEMTFELPKYLLDAKGNRVWNETPDENIEHKVGDIWFEKNGLYQRLYIWNGEMWEKRIDTEDVSKVGEKFDAEVKKINQSMATQTQQTAQALRTAGANSSAIEAAKGAITKLNQDLTGAKQTNQAAIDRLKSDFASAQRTVNDQTALLRSDLANIRTQQTQAESEIAKQVAALNAAKTELAGVKSAQATFEQTAQGLRTDLSAVQAYVAADGTRAEALRTYSREETARQLTAERKLIEAGYVGKAQHTEDVRGLTRRFEELTVGGRNLMGVFNTKPVKSSFDRETYKFTAKTTQNTTRPTLMLQFRWTDGSYSAVITISETGRFARKFKITKPYSELRVKFNCNREDAVLLFTGKQFIEPNTDYYFTGDLIKLAPNDSQADFLKIEKATITSDWSPAPEDATNYADTKLAEYKQSIDGQLATVQAAINTANSSLTSFNNWKQSAQETLNKVGRVESGLNETKTSLAEFKRTAEGQLTTITQQVAGKANQTEFQRIQETSKLYERLIGSTEKEVTDKVSRMALTNELFQVEVSKNLGLRTVQYQIANAWAVQNLDSNGDIVSQINATGPNVRIQGESIHLDGKALIDNGIIKNAMIESMLADKITAGTLNAANVNIINLNANKIVGLDANFIKSKIELALVDWLKGKVITAQNDAMKIDLNNGQYNVMTDQAAIRRVLNDYPNQFLKFTSETEGGAPASVTVLGANRDGTENSKNDSFAGIRLFSGNKVERTEIISDVVRFATGAVNYRGWEMRTLYGNDNRQVILQPFGNVTRSNIVANYFNGIDLVNVLETLNQMMANLGNHTGRHDIFGPIRGLGARKYAR